LAAVHHLVVVDWAVASVVDLAAEAFLVEVLVVVGNVSLQFLVFSYEV
jgi:hypothetical protein